MFAILFIISFCITYFVIPLVIKIGHKYNLLDLPNARKEHKKPLVRIGGIGIFFSYFLLLICLRIFFPEQFFTQSYNILRIFLISNVLIFFVGLFDDLYSLSPFIRLIIQFIISIIVWLNNIKIESIKISFINFIDPITLPSWLSLIFTSILIIGIMNSINWIDGLDGLAIGIISCCLFSIYALNQNLNINLIEISIPILMGSCIAFLKYNFFPSKILMGDSGSNVLGFNLALMGILVSSETLINDLNIKESYDINVDIFLIIFALPILDMAYVICKRIINKKSPFFPDRNHLHHRMLNFGFSHKQTVLNLYVFGLSNILILMFLKTNKYFYLILLSICLILSIYNFLKLLNKKRNKAFLSSKK